MISVDTTVLVRVLVNDADEADFSDYLILADARERSLKVVTFDKRFSGAEEDTILIKA